MTRARANCARSLPSTALAVLAPSPSRAPALGPLQHSKKSSMHACLAAVLGGAFAAGAGGSGARGSQLLLQDACWPGLVRQRRRQDQGTCHEATKRGALRADAPTSGGPAVSFAPSLCICAFGCLRINGRSWALRVPAGLLAPGPATPPPGQTPARPPPVQAVQTPRARHAARKGRPQEPPVLYVCMGVPVATTSRRLWPRSPDAWSAAHPRPAAPLRPAASGVPAGRTPLAKPASPFLLPSPPSPYPTSPYLSLSSPALSPAAAPAAPRPSLAAPAKVCGLGLAQPAGRRSPVSWQRAPTAARPHSSLRRWHPPSFAHRRRPGTHDCGGVLARGAGLDAGWWGGGVGVAAVATT